MCTYKIIFNILDIESIIEIEALNIYVIYI